MCLFRVALENWHSSDLPRLCSEICIELDDPKPAKITAFFQGSGPRLAKITAFSWTFCSKLTTCIIKIIVFYQVFGPNMSENALSEGFGPQLAKITAFSVGFGASSNHCVL